MRYDIPSSVDFCRMRLIFHGGKSQISEIENRGHIDRLIMYCGGKSNLMCQQIFRIALETIEKAEDIKQFIHVKNAINSAANDVFSYYFGRGAGNFIGRAAGGRIRDRLYMQAETKDIIDTFKLCYSILEDKRMSPDKIKAALSEIVHKVYFECELDHEIIGKFKHEFDVKYCLTNAEN